MVEGGAMNDTIRGIFIVFFIMFSVLSVMAAHHRDKIIENQETIMAQLNTIQLNQSHMMPPESDRAWSTKKSIQDKIK